MILLRTFKNLFTIPELRQKLMFTLGVIFVYRLGTFIPVIGVDGFLLAQYMESAKTLGGLFQFLDTFSGSALAQCTVFALGIGPYITASIMMQLLSMSIPSLELLVKEGEHGRKIINQYTRYLACVLSIVYSFGYATFLVANGLVIDPGIWFRIVFMTTLTAGSMFVMWLGEQVSLFGLGNGASVIVFAGIVARFPRDILSTVLWVMEDRIDVVGAVGIWAIFVILTMCIIFLERGDRKVPVQYARRVIGNRMYAGQSTYIPFKLNPVGVMPVLFAQAILNIPLQIAGFLAGRFDFFKSLLGDYLAYNGLLFNILTFVLIIIFYYVYAALLYNPVEIADNLKKNGGFVPGIRPGKQTADFFDFILTRIGVAGALYLATLAVLPTVIYSVITMPFFLSGTSILIAVGVALDTSAQIEAYLIERRYEGFLSIGRVKGRVS